jgi:hypothetical protein
MTDLTNYVQRCITFINSKSGKNLAQCIVLPLGKTKAKSMTLMDRRVNLVDFCSTKISDTNLAITIGNRLAALLAIENCDLVQAYRNVQEAYNGSLEYFSNKDDEDTSWFIPVFVILSNDLRIVAEMADKSTCDSENSLLRESLQSLTKGWTVVAKDRTMNKKTCFICSYKCFIQNIFFVKYSFTLWKVDKCC